MTISKISRRVFLGVIGAGAATAALGTPPAAAGTPHPLSVDAFPPDVIRLWFETLYDAVVAEGLTPTNAARTYAYCAIAGYEAAVPGMPDHRTMAGQLRGLPPLPTPRSGRIDWSIVVSAAIHGVAHDLFANGLASTVGLIDETHARVVADRAASGVAWPHVRAAEGHGARVASALVGWIQRDGYAEIQGRPYTPPVGDALWASTPPNFGTAIEPYWHEVRPLVLEAPAEVVPADPIPFSAESGSAFRAQVDAVLATAAALTDDHKAIARFWTDNPRTSGLPSGHWHLITSQLGAIRSLPLSARLEAHARVGVVMHDAFLNCWTWKYRYNLLRPVTYIRRYIDPTFSTFVNTPQFPEYVSGHSVVSGAAAVVLTDLFGTIAFTDDSHAARGMPARHFTSIWDAAHEAAQSRIYGGIHYPMGIQNGVAQGADLGDLVVSRLRTRR